MEIISASELDANVPSTWRKRENRKMMNTWTCKVFVCLSVNDVRTKVKVQLRQVSFHLYEFYLVNDICSREKDEKSDILHEYITETMIDENRSVKSIYKSQDRDVSFSRENLIGKKRREVSFGFNEHESKERCIQLCIFCLKVYAQFLFFVFYIVFPKKTY